MIPQFLIDLSRKQQEDYIRLQNLVEHARQIEIENAKERAKDNVEEWQDGC